MLGAHLAMSLAGASRASLWLAVLGGPLAAMTAIYTAFLFAQAKARDLWQSPLLPPHLAVQAIEIAHTNPLWIRAARLVNERAVAQIQRAGASERRLAHTQLFPHITFEGVRLTEIARRLEVTKQAIGPLIDELDAAGMVDRIADPSDQRAKLIRWTPRGRRALEHGLGVLAQLEPSA